MRALRNSLLFILLSPGLSGAQPLQKIDSLRALLASHLTFDTTRVDILNALGFEHWTVDPQQSEDFGMEAAKEAKTLNYLRGRAMAYRVIGVSFWSRGELVKSTEFLLESQALYRQLKDSVGEANSTMNLGMAYVEQGEYGRALENYFVAQSLFESKNLSDRLALLYSKIGTVYLAQHQPGAAENYLVNSLRLHREHDFDFGVMEASNRLGLLHLERNELDEAERFLGNSLAIAEKNGDQEHLIKNLENLSRIHLRRGDYAKAKANLDRAFPIAEKTHYKKWMRDILFGYGELYRQLNNPELSLKFVQQYIALKDSIFNEEKAAQLSNLKLTEQRQTLLLREQEIALLKQKEKIDQLTKMTLAASGALVLLGSAALFSVQRRRYLKKHHMAQMRKQITEQQLASAKVKEKELQSALEGRNKELASYTINFIRKNELIHELHEKLKALKAKFPQESQTFNSILSLLQTDQIDRDWEDFRRTFENVHHHFFSKLLNYNPDLTPAELRLCALICLNLSIKEMAALLAISPDSVKTARYRLRKKLGIDQETNLTEFILAFT